MTKSVLLSMIPENYRLIFEAWLTHKRQELLPEAGTSAFMKTTEPDAVANYIKHELLEELTHQ